MQKPSLSLHFQTRQPSSIRLAQIEFLKRTDHVIAVNTAIGNVSLPMHPAMVKRMFTLGGKGSPFEQGVVEYSTTVGNLEANAAVLHLIESSGFSTQGLHSQMTHGGSQAMELMIIGVCGEAGSTKHPLLLIDPAYSNYTSMAERTGRSTVSVSRCLEENGKFTVPKLAEIEEAIQKSKPAALLVIPYDNPTGQFLPQTILNDLAKLCVQYNLWFISDEAYREMVYADFAPSSIWGVTEEAVPGITGRRISIESASKLWNACGLRIGALVTDNQEFHLRSVAENTANLCANVIGQYIFGALLHESKQQLQAWFKQQRDYYSEMGKSLAAHLKERIPGLIVSTPDAALYSVVDVRNQVGADFDANDFVLYCAKQGQVLINGIKKTLLVAPMDGFYSSHNQESRFAKTQMRIAYVEPPEIMKEVPYLFSRLLADFMEIR